MFSHYSSYAEALSPKFEYLSGLNYRGHYKSYTKQTYFERIKNYFRKYIKKRIKRNLLLFEDTEYDRLPKTLGIDETYRYIVPMTEMRNKIQRFNEEYNQTASNARIFIVITRAKNELHFKLDKELKNVIFNPDVEPMG